MYRLSHLAFYFCEEGYSLENTPEAFATRVAALAQAGFDGVELMVRDADAVDAAALKGVLAQNGVVASAIGSGKIFTADGLCLTSPRAEVRRAAVERLKGHIRLSAQLGGPPVILGSVRGDSCTDFAAQMDFLRESLAACCPYAEQHGVRLALEPMDRSETPFLHNTAQALALILQIGSPALGLTLDSCNMNLEERDLFAAIASAGNRIFHVQVADTLRHYPAWGHFAFAPFLQALATAGYRGFVSVEPCVYEASPIEDARRGLLHLQRCCAELHT